MQHVGGALDRLGVGQAQGPDRIEYARGYAERIGLAGLDAERGRAELRELVDDVAVDAFTDGRQQDDGSDPDSDAERGQDAAHAMGCDRLGSETKQIGTQHGIYFARASTGSRRAARRAGRMPKIRPLATATPQPASAAHTGAWKSMIG